MIRVIDNRRVDEDVVPGGVWIGDSTGEEHGDLDVVGIGAVLNVAQDMDPTRKWTDGIEYLHVGLIDGPGNPLYAYVACVLSLAVLRERHSEVLVCCHTGSRSLAVIIMYLSAMAGRGWPGDWTAGWNGWLERIRRETDTILSEPHGAHRAAFNKMNWRLIVELLTRKEK